MPHADLLHYTDPFVPARFLAGGDVWPAEDGEVEVAESGRRPSAAAS